MFINILSICLHEARLLERIPVALIASYIASLQVNINYFRQLSILA